MGLYPGAHLVFGVLMTPYNEEGEPTHPLFEEDSDVESVLAENQGLADPWKSLPPEMDYSTHDEFEHWKNTHPDWVESKEKWHTTKKDLRDSSPVELQRHGHYDDPEGPPTFLVLKGYEFRGDAWSPEKISPSSMQVHHNVIEQADEFCETNGLPSFDDPKWYLVASYG